MSDANLGCCGYDDLATKPPTTTPFTFSRKNQLQASRRNPNPNVTRPVYSMGAVTPVRFPVMNIQPGR